MLKDSFGRRECPFCKKNNVGLVWFPMQAHVSSEMCIQCLECGCYGPNADDNEDAKKRWNERGDGE